MGMKHMIDFSNCPESGIVYAGSEKKAGILYKNEAYMLKFRKMIHGQPSYSHVSEYLASHIMKTLGLDVHDTVLGIYKGEEVVAVKDFTVQAGETLVEFASTGDYSFDTERDRHTLYSYEEIVYLLEQHRKIIKTEILIQRFWEMFIADALTANFDRHGYNWGFLKGRFSYRLAPVYDNGSSLFPRLQDKDLDMILGSKEEMDKRTFQFPTSQILLNGKKSSYYDVINSGKFKECRKAREKIIDKIDFQKIDQCIEKTVFVSEKRKEFYREIIRYRCQHILQREVN